MWTCTISLQWCHTMFLPAPSTPYLISFPYTLQFLNSIQPSAKLPSMNNYTFNYLPSQFSATY
jgi:hypothetical protein